MSSESSSPSRASPTSPLALAGPDARAASMFPDDLSAALPLLSVGGNDHHVSGSAMSARSASPDRSSSSPPSPQFGAISPPPQPGAASSSGTGTATQPPQYPLHSSRTTLVSSHPLSRSTLSPKTPSSMAAPKVDFALLGSLLSVNTSDHDAEQLARSLLGDDNNNSSRAAIMASKAAELRKSYDPDARFTYFSASQGLLQGNSLAAVATDMLGRFRSSGAGAGAGAGAGTGSPTPSTTASAVEPFWLDVQCPTPIDLALLTRIFAIHPLTVEDVTTDEAREKSEVYDHYLFVCLRTLADDADDLDGLKLKESFYYVLLFKDCVLTVRHEPLRHAYNVALRLVTGSGLSATSAAMGDEDVEGGEVLAPDWVVYTIVDDIIDSMRPVIQGLEFDADGIDDLAQILKWNEQADLLQRLRRASKKVTQLIRLLHFKEEVVKSLSNRSASYIQPSTTVYLRDIFDHIVTLQHSLAIIKDTLHTAHTGYHSQLSVAMSQLSNNMNASMKRISVIGAAFVPITAVTGCFGMNVPVPWGVGNEEDSVLTWFFLIIGVTIVVSVGAIGYLEHAQRRRQKRM